MASPTIQFLRPTFYALIAFAFLVGIANLYWATRDASLADVTGAAPRDLAGLDLSEVVFPSPALTPDAVVRLQIKGLSDAKRDGVGILQCFCLASPANRSITGPLKRFGQMVRTEPYNSMSAPRALLIGRPTFDNQVARLLVTVVDEENNVRVFAFVLSRQDEAPFRDCWMTDAVLSASPQITPPPAPNPSA